MTEQTIQPAMLNYAKRSPRTWRPLVRFYGSLFFCLLVGGITGWLVSPTLYRSEGAFELPSVSASSLNAADSPDLQKLARTNLDALHSPEHLAETANRLREKGIHLTTAEIGDRILASHRPQSEFISVAATDHDPQVAAAIVREVMEGFPLGARKLGSTDSGMRFMKDGSNVQLLQYAGWFVVIGSAIGLIVWSVNELRRRAGTFVLAGRPRTRVFEY